MLVSIVNAEWVCRVGMLSAGAWVGELVGAVRSWRMCLHLTLGCSYVAVTLLCKR